jgi:hypothetical protein
MGGSAQTAPLPCNSAARDVELDQLKMLIKQPVDKVNAPGETPADRLAAVEDRVDEVAVHGIRLGTTLGLAAMATHTNVDYSIQPRGLQGGAPEDIDEIEVILELFDGHDDAIAEITHSQSVLNRLFDLFVLGMFESSAINNEISTSVFVL